VKRGHDGRDDPLRVAARETRNRDFWDGWSDEYQADHGSYLDSSDEPAWGIWQIPEAELRILGDVAGRDILELGCGGAQWSIKLARLGARPVGLDLSARQLEHARRLMGAAGVAFPLVHASAEAVPLGDALFDVVFSDWGGMSFADPARTLPEAARLLRPGGLLAFNTGTPFVELCRSLDEDHPQDRLQRDYFGLYEVDDGEVVEFIPTYGEWVRLFRQHRFVIEDLLEIRPPKDAVSTYRDAADRAWSRRWPEEQIWRVRKEPSP
jgi:SAM-dependent methyltransferase